MMEITNNAFQGPSEVRHHINNLAQVQPSACIQTILPTNRKTDRITMDAASYKKHTTTRGFSYNYFFAAAQPGKSTLIFLHGFPSSSWDWTQEAIFFKARGYGLIVPDMLGYAGSDKPTDPKVYVGSGLAKDIVDIMDHEGVEKAVAIGHDWCECCYLYACSGSDLIDLQGMHPRFTPRKLLQRSLPRVCILCRGIYPPQPRLRPCCSGRQDTRAHRTRPLRVLGVLF